MSTQRRPEYLTHAEFVKSMNLYSKIIAEEIREAMGHRIAGALMPLLEKMAEYDATGGAAGCRYAGTYVVNRKYAPGELVTRSGGLWLAVSPSIGERPGGSAAWKLIVKSGTAGGA